MAGDYNTNIKFDKNIRLKKTKIFRNALISFVINLPAVTQSQIENPIKMRKYLFIKIAGL